jgi:hypothetical protein
MGKKTMFGLGTLIAYILFIHISFETVPPNSQKTQLSLRWHILHISGCNALFDDAGQDFRRSNAASVKCRKELNDAPDVYSCFYQFKLIIRL